MVEGRGNGAMGRRGQQQHQRGGRHRNSRWRRRPDEGLCERGGGEARGQEGKGVRLEKKAQGLVARARGHPPTKSRCCGVKKGDGMPESNDWDVVRVPTDGKDWHSKEEGSLGHSDKKPKREHFEAASLGGLSAFGNLRRVQKRWWRCFYCPQKSLCLRFRCGFLERRFFRRVLVGAVFLGGIERSIKEKKRGCLVLGGWSVREGNVVE